MDLLSVLPFETIASSAGGASEAVQFVKIMRIIRLLRLLKLMRVLRASRIFKRFEESVSIKFAYLSLMKFSTLLLIVAHWMACAWVLVGDTQPAG